MNQVTKEDCDSHVHIFDPARFPYVSGRRFTPGSANVDALKAHLAEAGARRAVIVQPSVYGTRNECLLDALRRMAGAARGVVVVDESIQDAALADMDAAGVRGARINSVVAGKTNANEARQEILGLDLRLPVSWHIQLHVSLQTLIALQPTIEESRRMFVLDHFGLITPATQTSVRSSLLPLFASGKVYVKLSAPYLLSNRENYADLRNFVELLADSRPDRLLWGTNWPHTQGISRTFGASINAVEPFRTHNDKAWKDVCQTWVKDHVVKVMVRNSAELYGFT